jgi:hypothetical protein
MDVELLVLRHQLAVLARQEKRPALRPADHAFLAVPWLGKAIIAVIMPRKVLRPRPRSVCRDLEPECFTLFFCEAWRCAVDLRRGLTGDLTHCPICGVDAVVHYPDVPKGVGCVNSSGPSRALRAAVPGS